MAYNSDMKFNRPFRCGKPTRYFEVLYYLYKHGATRKSELLDAIWTFRGNVIDRGYCSNMFGQMNSAELIWYNKHDHKLYIDKRGVRWLSNMMNVYGVKNLENLFNYL